MKEELLYFIWQLQYFEKKSLTTTKGEVVHVLASGTRNEHSGPDFDQARLRIGGIEWVGSVEIHINASDWNAHRHQNDLAYNRVVLHVVWNDDQVVYRQDGTTMPTLVLKYSVAESVLKNYRHLVFESSTQQAIPCAAHLPYVNDLAKLSMIEKTAVLRLVRKSHEIGERLSRNQGDWTVVAYQTLVKSFGFHLNGDAFEQLSFSAPISLIAQYRSEFDTLAALFLGQAGLIGEDRWPTAWRETYQFLQAKHQLADRVLAPSQWRFFRTRPANFPTVRIMQLASLLVSLPKDLTYFFDHLPVDHYYALFDDANNALRGTVPAIGRDSINKILINAVVPYQFAFGNFFQEQHQKDHALSLLQSLPAEKNRVVDKYREYGYSLKSAFDTQAILELHHSFCKKKQCLSCTVGGQIVKNNKFFVTSAS